MEQQALSFLEVSFELLQVGSECEGKRASQDQSSKEAETVVRRKGEAGVIEVLIIVLVFLEEQLLDAD